MSLTDLFEVFVCRLPSASTDKLVFPMLLSVPRRPSPTWNWKGHWKRNLQFLHHMGPFHRKPSSWKTNTLAREAPFHRKNGSHFWNIMSMSYWQAGLQSKHIAEWHVKELYLVQVYLFVSGEIVCRKCQATEDSEASLANTYYCYIARQIKFTELFSTVSRTWKYYDDQHQEIHWDWSRGEVPH